jgi:hypothetical protein
MTYLKEHDKFEELASLAPLGELSQSEYEEFLRHRNTCNQCRKTYEDTSALAEAAFVVGSSIEEDRVVEDQRHRRARQEIARRLAPAPVSSLFLPVTRGRSLVAMATIAGFVLGAYIGGIVRLHSEEQSASSYRNIQPRMAAPVVTGDQVAKIASSTRSSELEHELEISRRGKQFLQQKLHNADRNALVLADQLRDLTDVNNRLISEQEQNRGQLAGTQTNLVQARMTIQSDEATINALRGQVANRETQLSELKNSLERERGMLSAGREIRDIMGARELHIVDVVDRDSKGRARKAFGRAFYTQGKSLIFYAFDLPAKNTADGKFVYAAWGNNSNNLNNKAMHSLGIFYSDDQTQHRWTMKFDDPKTLEEIDTVFVTLEPANHPLTAPTGKSILEAYFGTPPNHP